MFATLHPLCSDPQLLRRLSVAGAPSLQLFAAVAECSDRFRSLRNSGKLERLIQLVEDAAWTDAALELLPIVAPRWKVKPSRRSMASGFAP